MSPSRSFMAPRKEIDRLKVLLKIEVEKQNRSFGIINAMRRSAQSFEECVSIAVAQINVLYALI